MKIHIRTILSGAGLLVLMSVLSAGEAPVMKGEQKIETPDLVTMLKTGDFDGVTKIIEDYQAIFEQDPANELYAVVPYRQFIAAAIDKELEEMLEQWEHHSTGSFAPYMASCSYNYGALWTRKHGRVLSEKALEDLRVDCDWALRINPRLPYAYGRMIKAANMANNREESKRWLKRGISVLPASYFVRSAYQPGLYPYRGGSNEEMMAFAEQSQVHVNKNPMLIRLMADAYNELGNQYSRKDSHNKAIEYYKKSLEYYIDVNPLISIAANYSSIGENMLAVETLTQLIEFHGEPGIYKRRARAYGDAGKFKKALADIDVALKAEPENPRFIRAQANIFYDMDDFETALAGYERVVAIKNTDSWVWGRIAYIKQRKIVDIPGAERGYMQALMFNPRYAWAWHEYGTLLYNKKDERAPTAFQTYLDLCDSGESCDPVLVLRSRKFLDCVAGKPECALEQSEYEAWFPNV